MAALAAGCGHAAGVLDGPGLAGRARDDLGDFGPHPIPHAGGSDSLVATFGP